MALLGTKTKPVFPSSTIHMQLTREWLTFRYDIQLSITLLITLKDNDVQYATVTSTTVNILNLLIY